MRTVPALPWPTGDGGGTIKLSRRISEDDLLAGVLKFTFDNAGRESVGSVVRDQNNQLIIRVDNDIFIVSPFPYGTDTLTLTRVAGEAAQAYSLINVELVPTIASITPSTPWDFDSVGTLEFTTGVDQEFILTKLLCNLVHRYSGSTSTAPFVLDDGYLAVKVGQVWVARMETFEGKKSSFQITTNSQEAVEHKVNGFSISE